MSVPAHTEGPQSRNRRAARSNRAWRWAAFLLAGVLSALGCANPMSTISWFATQTGSENDEKPKFCSLSIKDKEAKVLILAAHEDPLPNQFFHDAHRELSRKLGTLVEQCYKEEGDKVKVVPFSKVFSYMDDHQEWITESKQALGKRFGADFVIFLELGSMTMFEQGSSQMLYRGNGHIRYSVYDVREGEEDTDFKEGYYSCTFPETGPIEASGGPVAAFRAKFLDRIAHDLMKEFAPHPAGTMEIN